MSTHVQKMLTTAYQYTQSLKQSNNQIIKLSNNQIIKYTQTLKHSNNQTNTQMLINAYKWSSVLENASKCLPHAYQRRKVPEESCSCLLMSAANEYCSGVTTYSIYFATICKTLSSSATRKKKHIKNKKQKN